MFFSPPYIYENTPEPLVQGHTVSVSILLVCQNFVKLVWALLHGI